MKKELLSKAFISKPIIEVDLDFNFIAVNFRSIFSIEA